jgi:diguanylate cyclase (GGDEF)-like protein
VSGQFLSRERRDQWLLVLYCYFLICFEFSMTPWKKRLYLIRSCGYARKVTKVWHMGSVLALHQGLPGSLTFRPSGRRWTFGLIACVCAVIVGMVVWQLWRVYDTNIQQTEVVTSNTARSVAEHTETTLKTADTIVASLVERVEAEGTGPEARVRFYRLMTSLAAALPAIHEMGIMDSQGNAVVKSLVANPVGLNYAERGYFRYHAANTDRGPFIGARIKSKIDGTYNITVTRRINRPDGSFAGVVVTSVSMKFFQQLFDEMQAKSGGVIALFADDGTILARSPHIPTESGDVRMGGDVQQQMRNPTRTGTLTYLSAIDGVRRRGSYQHLSQFPLTTLVSQSEWDLQSGWRVELRSYAIILACIMVVVGVLGGRAVKANRMLGAQAMQDGLTGLANRRVFDETIEREFRRMARSGQPISLIMNDIDHFKDYNDGYGHLAGDECLRTIARTIQGCVRRAGDLAARYGGEEIAVVMPGSDAQHASAFAETIRLAVRCLALQHTRSVHGIVTFSAGVATCMPGQTPGGSQALIGNADAALYAAKDGGRDTVKTYPSTPAAISSAQVKVLSPADVAPLSAGEVPLTTGAVASRNTTSPEHKLIRDELLTPT